MQIDTLMDLIPIILGILATVGTLVKVIVMSRLDKNEAELSKVVDRVNNLEKEFCSVAESVDQMEKRLDRFETKIDSLIQMVHQLMIKKD